MKFFIYFILICLIISLFQALWPFAIFVGLIIILFFVIKKILYVIFKIYERKYYKSNEFIEIKSSVAKHIEDCNELNRYIEELKNTHIGNKQSFKGSSNYYDNSEYNYKRPEFKNHINQDNVYNCSRTICDNARTQPFKYICKYFDIDCTEEHLEKFENLLNKYQTAEDGIKILNHQKSEILNSVYEHIPYLIKKFGYENFQYNLGFDVIDFGSVIYPQYSFVYVSSGGNASTKCDILMDKRNLNDFILYLSEKIKFRKSIQGQRALMTTKLRNEILLRDNYTCQNCGISNREEKNLLLEVDHIIPLSKGGFTSVNNLQTLCWKCNRTKGNKILDNINVEQNKNKNNNVIQKEITNVINEIEKKTDKHLEEITLPKKQEIERNDNMYDLQKGIYPEGQYVVGEDIEIGKYLLKSKKGYQGSISIYESYEKFKEDEILSFKSFEEDFYLPLREKGIFIEISNAEIEKM